MELPIITFIQARLQEANPAFDTRQGSAHYDLFVQPQEFMLQPLNDYMSQRRVGQSVRQMLLDPTPDTPTTFASSDVDDLASNFYITRDQGSLAFTTARVYYITPKALSFPALTAQFTAGSLNFFNSTDFTLSAADMALQSDGSLFYADIPVQSEAAGSQYNVDPGSITAILNDPDAVRVTNLFKAVDGLPAQTNTQLLNQIPNSIGVRDLETDKGINAILNQNFPFLQQIVPIGMGDPEMQRDIQYNIHTGAKTDVYLKTPNLTTGTFTAKGLVIDTTREIPRNFHIEMARSLSDSEFPADTGTPSIVSGSVVVKEDIIETAASLQSVYISPVSGIDLSSTQWLNITIDSRAPVQVKVAGAIPTQTRLFEIINAINAGVGLVVATAGPGNTFTITSPTIGAGSQISINATTLPILTANNAADVLFGISLGSLPKVLTGVVANTYLESVDYTVDYATGAIYQTPFTIAQRGLHQSITSGQTMVPSVSNAGTGGKIQLVGVNYQFQDNAANAFDTVPLVYVRPGDELTITSINGFSSGTQIGISIPSTYIVSDVLSGNALSLAGFNPTGTSTNVTYSIVSTQTVNISYKYNPISIDIGSQVLLPDGTRGIRPGRSAFTITDVPFIKILSIQQVDPNTLEPLGSPLVQPSGYGAAGYGQGGYGQGASGDYIFYVNSPTERFSVFEDSVIVFNENALGLSYTVTYYYNPELVAIHNLTRNDTERVTGADILVKSMVPCFVDMTIGIRRDPTNINTPADADLATLVEQLVNAVVSPNGLKESAIEALLMGEGVASVQTPFTMLGTVYNTDGSTSIIQSTDVLQVPTPTLPSQTDNFTTARISHFWPGNISVVEVT